MHYPEDLPPSLAEIRADHQDTLASFRRHLDESPFWRAEIEPGVNMYAIHMPSYTKYGAQEGDESLMAVIYELPEEQGKSYTVMLSHHGEKLGDVSNDPEVFTFLTDPSDDELEAYNMDAAGRVRAILEDAADNNWFSIEEAWYRVKNRYPSRKILDAYNAQRRSERRTASAVGAALIREIEEALNG